MNQNDLKFYISSFLSLILEQWQSHGQSLVQESIFTSTNKALDFAKKFYFRNNL